jgi:hypothetical protein
MSEADLSRVVDILRALIRDEWESRTLCKDDVIVACRQIEELRDVEPEKIFSFASVVMSIYRIEMGRREQVADKLASVVRGLL